MKHKRWLIGALVAVLLLLGAHYNFNMRWLDFGTLDRLAYWSVPRAALLGHGFYNMEWLREVQVAHGYDPALLGWKDYPVELLWTPAPFLLWLLPTAAISFTANTLLWIGFSLLAYAHAAWLFNRTLSRPLPSALLLVLPSVSMPLFGVMYWGQITPLLAACLIYAWLALHRNRQVAAGLLMVPLLIKPHLLFISLILLVSIAWHRRWWRMLLTFGAMVSLLVLLTFALDPAWFSGWMNQGTPDKWPTFSVLDIIRWGAGLPVWIRLLGMPIGASLALWHYRKTETISPRLLGESVLFSILLAPYLGYHDLAILLPVGLWIQGIFWNDGKLRFLLCLLIGANLWTEIVWYGDFGSALKLTPYLLYCSLFVLFWVIAGRWHHRTVPRAVAALRSVPQKEQVL